MNNNDWTEIVSEYRDGVISYWKASTLLFKLGFSADRIMVLLLKEDERPSK